MEGRAKGRGGTFTEIKSRHKVVDLYSASSSEHLMRSRDHLSYGITQCYLPPGRGDSPDFTLAFTSTHCSKGAQPVPKAQRRCGREEL